LIVALKAVKKGLKFEKTVNSQKTTPRCPGHREFVTPLVAWTSGNPKSLVFGTPRVKTPWFMGHWESQLPHIPETAKK